MTDALVAWVDGVARAGLRPEPLQTVSEWADANRLLDGKSSAEPGRWRTARTPYLRAIMDDLSPWSPVERVVFMKGSQVGGTEVGFNFLGAMIDGFPGPSMYVGPTIELAKHTAKTRLDPMVALVPSLRAKVASPRERDGGSTVQEKAFPGGFLLLTGGNSAAGLRSTPIAYLVLDEVDSYPGDLDGEGDPVALAIRRTETFRRRKIFTLSTPTVAGASRIEAEYEASDKRQFLLACPDCGHRQALEWSHVVWTDIGVAPADACYRCAGCEVPIPHSAKADMLAGGVWQPTQEGPPGVHGYHLPGLYSPWVSWGEAALEYIKSKGSPTQRKTFHNTYLGLPFSESEDEPDWKRLYERCEDYEHGKVPHGGLVLTCGCDVQKDRIECEIVAWGRGWQSWSVDYRVLEGSPALPSVWAKLDGLLGRSFLHAAGGELPIARLAIDTGGHFTSEVYGWCSRHDSARIMAIKGVDGINTPLAAPTYIDVARNGRRLRRGAQLWPVSVSLIKSQLYARLRLDRPDEGEPYPDGYCHFPKYSEEHFRQLTAERLTLIKTRGGGRRRGWEPTRERNERLDCRIYAVAAAYAEGLGRWTEDDWKLAEEMAGQRRASAPGGAAADPMRTGGVIKSAWLNR